VLSNKMGRTAHPWHAKRLKPHYTNTFGISEAGLIFYVEKRIE